MNLTTVLDFFNQWGILGVMLFFVAFAIVNYITSWKPYFEKRHEKYASEDTHAKSLKARKEKVLLVKEVMKDLVDRTDADRAIVFEYHNGGANLTGLQFLHMTPTIQQNKLGVDELTDQFNNMLLSAIPHFINRIDKEGIVWYDDIKELKSVFPGMYKELTDDGFKSIVVCPLQGINTPIGFIILGFMSEHKVTKEFITGDLSKKSQQISTLLDFTNVE